MKEAIPMTDEVISLLDEQVQIFKERFGREPGPHDPLLFDPDSDGADPVSMDPKSWRI